MMDEYVKKLTKKERINANKILISKSIGEKIIMKTKWKKLVDK